MSADLSGAPGLRTVALVKQVPRGDHAGLLGGDGRLLRQGHDAELNPWCRRAVTRAVELARESGGHCTVVTMGPPSAQDVLREALACGADAAVHVCDPLLAGADCVVTAKALAAAIRTLGGADLVLVGRSTVDGSTGAVGPMVAELLGMPFAGPALTLAADRCGSTTRLHTTLQLEGATEDVAVVLPAVVAVAERSCAPAKAPAEDWPDASAVRRVSLTGLGQTLHGSASPTRVRGTADTRRTRRPVILDGDLERQVAYLADVLVAPGPADPVALPMVPLAHAPRRGAAVLVVTPRSGGLGTRALLGEAAALAERVDGRVVVAGPELPGPEHGGWGADEALLLGDDAPRPVAAALCAWLGTDAAWAVLGGAGSWEREVLARVAVALGAGLMSDLVGLQARRTGAGPMRLIGVKPTGTGMLAEIESDGAPQVATVRTGSLAVRRPRNHTAPVPVAALPAGADPDLFRSARREDDDYDALERAEVVIGVGRGVDPRQYGELDELRERLGAEFAATRKVTDAGWMPHSRQIGITARSIGPRCYLAIGTSGNLNHLAGAGRAGTVLAINSDPAAPIFGRCDVGVVGDWQVVVPLLVKALVERVPDPRSRRSGEPSWSTH